MFYSIKEFKNKKIVYKKGKINMAFICVTTILIRFYFRLIESGSLWVLLNPLYYAVSLEIACKVLLKWS